jgi:hypothetical protein
MMVTLCTIQAILLIVAAFFIGRANKTNFCLYIENKMIKHRLMCYRESNKDCACSYHIGRIASEGHEDFGKWAVYRMSTQEGLIFQTVIKVYDDDEDDVNKWNATELCDILNQK